MSNSSCVCEIYMKNEQGECCEIYIEGRVQGRNLTHLGLLGIRNSSTH
jgi:hypothetical protein